MKLAPENRTMPNSVAPQPRYQVGYLQLGAIKASWLHVLGQHAARHVQYHHQLHTTLLDNLDFAAPLGPRKCNDYQCYTHKPKGKPSKAHRSASTCAQPLYEDRIANAQQCRCPTRPGPIGRMPSAQAARPGRTGTVELRRSSGAQGSFLNAVFERTSSSSSNTRAGTRNQGRSSR